MIQCNSELLLTLAHIGFFFPNMNIFYSVLIHGVQRICLSVCEHNAATNAITSPPLWPVCVEMKHMPQKKGGY